MRKLRHEEIPRHSAEYLEKAPFHPVVAILENIRSAENVGSMFRSADAFRLEHLYLSGFTPTPDNSKLHRTALGSQDIVPWSKIEDIEAKVKELREKGYTIAALEITDEPRTAKTLDINAFPICFVVGNEIDGDSDSTLSKSDLALEIPQYGYKQSLNVAVSFGICAEQLVDRCRELLPMNSNIQDPRTLSIRP